MTRTDYDVIIVGAGPAGIFAALELTNTARPRVLMLDKGPDLDKRRCPSREKGRCVQCATCALMTGWGGSGAFSDGKLTLTTQVGGLLADIRGSAEAEQLVMSSTSAVGQVLNFLKQDRTMEVNISLTFNPDRLGLFFALLVEPVQCAERLLGSASLAQGVSLAV